MLKDPSGSLGSPPFEQALQDGGHVRTSREAASFAIQLIYDLPRQVETNGDLLFDLRHALTALDSVCRSVI